MNTYKPYELRATYQWIIDNGNTPILYAELHNHPMRKQFDESEVAFVISLSAVDSLIIGNETISFYASFDGDIEQISLSLDRITALVSEETSEGVEYDDFKRRGDPSVDEESNIIPLRRSE